MKLDQKQIRLLVNLQESLEQKEVKFLVFHADQKYTVTNELEDAMNIDSTLFMITSNNVVSLGPVRTETQEEIKQQVEMILTLIQNEVMDDKQIIEEEAVLVPPIEHPTYMADMFAVIAYELSYNREEIERILSTLKRMQPIYVEYFQRNRKSGIDELAFVAEKVLLQLNKSKETIDLFIHMLKDTIHIPHATIERKASEILTNLLFEQINIQ